MQSTDNAPPDPWPPLLLYLSPRIIFRTPWALSQKGDTTGLSVYLDVLDWAASCSMALPWLLLLFNSEAVELDILDRATSCCMALPWLWVFVPWDKMASNLLCGIDLWNIDFFLSFLLTGVVVQRERCSDPVWDCCIRNLLYCRYIHSKHWEEDYTPLCLLWKTWSKPNIFKVVFDKKPFI